MYSLIYIYRQTTLSPMTTPPHTSYIPHILTLSTYTNPTATHHTCSIARHSTLINFFAMHVLHARHINFFAMHARRPPHQLFRHAALHTIPRTTHTAHRPAASTFSPCSFAHDTPHQLFRHARPPPHQLFRHARSRHQLFRHAAMHTIPRSLLRAVTGQLCTLYPGA